MSNRSSQFTAVIIAAALLLTAGVASAQGVLFVKDNRVGIGESDPSPTGAILTLKTADGTGSGFKVETTNAVNNKNWFFTQNPVTGAFLVTNFFGGNAQMQIFPNVGGNNPANTFVIRNGGLGVGTQNVPINTVYLADGKTLSAETITERSSMRYKENVRPLEGSLEKIGMLRGVSYDLKSTGQGSIGFIAEEVGEVLPELVQYEENGVDATALSYTRITALLVEAVKTQQQQIEELQRQLAER